VSLDHRQRHELHVADLVAESGDFLAQDVHETVGAEGVCVQVGEIGVFVVRLVGHQADATGRILQALLLGLGVAFTI
jgi:hypothetical protein